MPVAGGLSRCNSDANVRDMNVLKPNELPMRDSISRRDFHKLTSAALGGMVAGTMIGCTSEVKEAKAAPAEPHACRGLNECKGQGADKKNACAGRATVPLHDHDCATQNDCKHQGGCGEMPAPGFNDCKTKGGCAVPMKGNMWDKARAYFEDQMKKEGKQIGAAPAAAAT